MKALVNHETNPLLLYLLITIPMGTFVVQFLSGLASAFILLNQFRVAKKEVDKSYGGDWIRYFKSFYSKKTKK